MKGPYYDPRYPKVLLHDIYLNPRTGLSTLRFSIVRKDDDKKKAVQVHKVDDPIDELIKDIERVQRDHPDPFEERVY